VEFHGDYLPFVRKPQSFLISNRSTSRCGSLGKVASGRIMSHIKEFYAHYESMGLITTALHEPDSRGLVPGIHVFLLLLQDVDGRA
jgi:hypothetical protein